jgi:DNA-binding transcriptional ArsR family regulator
MDMNKNYMRAIPKEWRNIAKLFAALGDEHRQRIVLTFEPRERLNVSQIVGVSTLSRTAVSHHLRVLREAGVLDSVKEGKEVYFSLDKKFVTDSLSTVLDYVKRYS